MKVKIGNKVYDAEDEPIMIILSEVQKEQLSNMLPEATKFCVYPDTVEWIKDDYAKIKAWMEDYDEEDV